MTHSSVVIAVGARESGLGANLQTALKVFFFLEAVAFAALNKSCCNCTPASSCLPMHAPCKDPTVLHGCPPRTPHQILSSEGGTATVAALRFA